LITKDQVRSALRPEGAAGGAPAQPDVYFTSDPPTRAGIASFYLALVILFRLLVHQLPESVAFLGLLGVTGGSLGPIDWSMAGIGILLVVLITHHFLSLLTATRFIHHTLDGWPQGAVRLIAWGRIVSMLFVGFCLSKVDQLWLALGFSILLLQLIKEGKRGPQNLRSFRCLGEVTWDWRLCWLAALLVQPALATDPGWKSIDLGVSLLVVVVALCSQMYPRLSFSYCFFHGKRTAQVVFERFLWLARIERLALVSLLALQLNNPQFFTNLTLFCAGRWLFWAVTRSIQAHPSWKETLHSESGPFTDACKVILPDRNSLNENRGPRREGNVPVDCFGDGPLSRPLEPPIAKKPSLNHTLPAETVLAFALLILTLFANAPWQASVSRDLTYQTRAIDQGGQVVLFQSSSTPGMNRLLDTMPYPRVQVQVGREPIVLTWLVTLTLLLGFYYRWRYTILGMWGLRPQRPSSPGIRLCLSILGSITLLSWMGWLWFPTKLSAVATLVLALQAPRPSRCDLPQSFRILGQEFQRLLQKPKPKEQERPLFIDPGQYLVEIGLGSDVFIAIAPERDEFDRFIPDLRRHFHESVGFELPNVKFTGIYGNNRASYGVLVENALVWVSPPQTSEEGQAPPSLQTISRDVLAPLIELAPSFLNRTQVEKILASATRKHEGLVHLVLQRHSRRIIVKTFRAVLTSGHSLSEPVSCLQALANSEGTDEQIVHRVLDTMESQSPNNRLIS
jgi:hypothetical protein